MSKNCLKIKARKDRLVARLGELGEVIEGSFFKREMNGRSRYYLSRMEGKVQRQHYVRTLDLDAVKTGNAQYLELLEIVRELSELNLKLIKESHEKSY